MILLLFRVFFCLSIRGCFSLVGDKLNDCNNLEVVFDIFDSFWFVFLVFVV